MYILSKTVPEHVYWVLSKPCLNKCTLKTKLEHMYFQNCSLTNELSKTGLAQMYFQKLNLNKKLTHFILFFALRDLNPGHPKPILKFLILALYAALSASPRGRTGWASTRSRMASRRASRRRWTTSRSIRPGTCD